MKSKKGSAGVERKGGGRAVGFLIAAGSLALLWTLAFLKGRADSNLDS
jgi:hypothetical protein